MATHTEGGIRVRIEKKRRKKGRVAEERKGDYTISFVFFAILFLFLRSFVPPSIFVLLAFVTHPLDFSFAKSFGDSGASFPVMRYIPKKSRASLRGY